jgi:hypothetical protein
MALSGAVIRYEASRSSAISTQSVPSPRSIPPSPRDRGTPDLLVEIEATAVVDPDR